MVGGQVGFKDDGTVPSDLASEVEEAFEHVERALRAAGLGEDAWEHVYKVSQKQPLLSHLLTLFADNDI